MEPSVIEEIRLTSFKSFRDAVLPLDDFTLLVGRNGSGKSNALDGLWTLARLAMAKTSASARRRARGPAVRGGVTAARRSASRVRARLLVRTGSRGRSPRRHRPDRARTSRCV